MTDHPLLTAVGLGPGDPELLTLKGLRAIQAAEVVFAPRGRDDAPSLALGIAAPWLDHQRQTIVEVTLPMVREAGQVRAAWRSAAETIAAALEGGRRGVYLLLGDPLLYGTIIYLRRELVALAPGLELRIIPGVTSFAAAAASGAVPLALAEERLAVLPASHEDDPARLRRALADFETVVLLKAGPALPRIVAALEETGLLDHALYAEHVGMPEELIVRDLRSLDPQRRPYLSLVIVRRGDRL
ncbi:MAG: precorrin-2 C(20)-methyltransferase [Chloroflexaceae bacterium]